MAFWERLNPYHDQSNSNQQNNLQILTLYHEAPSKNPFQNIWEKAGNADN